MLWLDFGSFFLLFLHLVLVHRCNAKVVVALLFVTLRQLSHIHFAPSPSLCVSLSIVLAKKANTRQENGIGSMYFLVQESVVGCTWKNNRKIENRKDVKKSTWRSMRSIKEKMEHKNTRTGSAECARNDWKMLFIFFFFLLGFFFLFCFLSCDLRVCWAVEIVENWTPKTKSRNTYSDSSESNI